MDGFVIAHTYSSVLCEIKALASELTRRVDILQRDVPPKHYGRKYKDAIIPFVSEINKLEAVYDSRIKEVADHIAQVSGEGWQHDKGIVHLWHQVALVVEKLSEHPTKKVAALIISKEGRLQAYSANRVPPGIKKKAEHYLEGVRKNYIVCAERMALSKFYELSGYEYKEFASRSRAKLLSNTVIEIGKRSRELNDSYMLATVVPCHECKPAILASRPRGIFVDTNTGKHFKRSEDFAETVSSFAANGITLHKLAV